MKATILFLILTVFTLASCTKTERQVVHDEGNAKGVVYSIQPEDWEPNSDSIAWYATLSIPELTDAILDHGAVLVYLSFKDGEYEPIPEVYNLLSYIPIQSKGQVDIEMSDIDGRIIANPPDGEIWAKVVLIDAQAIEMHPNVDLKNYDEVKQAFHLTR